MTNPISRSFANSIFWAFQTSFSQTMPISKQISGETFTKTYKGNPKKQIPSSKASNEVLLPFYLQQLTGHYLSEYTLDITTKTKPCKQTTEMSTITFLSP